jgi:hypothetical protein
VANRPLLVLLQCVDPNVLSGDEDAPLQQGETRFTPLHHSADLADPSDYSTHENQLILAKQLIEHGANVNAVSSPQCQTPLHMACFASNVTNLDFVELLLEKAQHYEVLDEATSSVDAKTDQEVQETIRREFVDKGVTVITVARRLDTVLGYDKITVLGAGLDLRIWITC